ncbi:hypothetical protein AGDE_01468 [Angomonas deanei]|uniref:Glutathione peroxidase n=1 Tax=Angomonas deanei TaxID=59799 RepID=A0A7G2C8D6_9TRYP|nr:hypothetical protein AGDE_01468 [Angomonas deanei]CAD2215849.1 hypothetical protein, conserved [Angomonas deanei]|eukprot:EPY42455.1 hypothetical protein AGDE_01468 [Angomonas deanei]
MAKVEVNGEHELPLFSFLKSRIKGTLGQASIKWNFTYFLVDRAGNPVARFAPDSTLEEVEAQVVKMLRNTETEPSSPTLQEDTSPPSRCDTGAGVDSA